jgi:leucyl aminopeptidase
MRVYLSTAHQAERTGEAPVLAKVTLLVAKADAAEAAAKLGLARGQAVAAGVAMARELANRPGNHCTPTLLARRPSKPGQGVRPEDRGAGPQAAGSSWAWAASWPWRRGRTSRPSFIVMHYQGAAKTVAPLVLVGKGITFDTGGISLKPGADMDEMKFDMGGAASVLGTLRAVARAQAQAQRGRRHPACENMPSGRATKPGDVVTSMSGQTIEVLNTDAEGRLILCDALTYAERFKPAAVVDIATLTGACVIALGHHTRAVLARRRAGRRPAGRRPGGAGHLLAHAAGRRVRRGLKSNFADMANIGGRPGGAITAAMFLQRFRCGRRDRLRRAAAQEKVPGG